MAQDTVAATPVEVEVPEPTTKPASMATIGSVYVRIWRFLRKRVQTKRAVTCSSAAKSIEPAKKILTKCHGDTCSSTPSPQTRLRLGTSGSPESCRWRMVLVLNELEACCATAREYSTTCFPSVARSTPPLNAALQSLLPTRRRSRAAQSKCANCGRLFFKDMAPTEAAIMEFCSLDCKSSNEYVREVQEHINNVLLETPVPQSINVTATSSEDTNTDKPISF